MHISTNRKHNKFMKNIINENVRFTSQNFEPNYFASYNILQHNFNESKIFHTPYCFTDIAYKICFNLTLKARYYYWFNGLFSCT